MKAEHLFQQHAWGRTLCGSDDDPVETLSPETFNEQLGLATGEMLIWDVALTPICAACVTKFIAELPSYKRHLQ